MQMWKESIWKQYDVCAKYLLDSEQFSNFKKADEKKKAVKAEVEIPAAELEVVY